MPNPFDVPKEVGRLLIKPAALLPRRGMLFLHRRTSRRNALLLLRLLFVLVGLIAIHTALFEYLMSLEGRSYSWITALYWTFSNMTTLGLGDITFFSDAGRLFNIIVLLSGLSFILILLPFTLIQLFQSPARLHRDLPPQTAGHIVLTHFDPITNTLLRRLDQFHIPYVHLVSDLDEALSLLNQGQKVVFGDTDDPETYRKVRAHNASLVAATGSDEINAAITYAVRQVSATVPVFSSATKESAEGVLKLAGATRVMKLDEMMAQSLARRITASDALAHVIGHVDDLAIAEATAAGTPLVGKTLAEARLDALVGAHVVGIWEHGSFREPRENTIISSRTVFLLAGDEGVFERYNELFCIYNAAKGPILVIGAGKVGRALGMALKTRELEYRIVERSSLVQIEGPHVVHGDASDVSVLREARIDDAPAVVLTSHDDHENIFLTTLIRHLRPDVQILSRVTMERTIPLLHKAGCDFALSYASMGANGIFNMLQSGNILMVAEGLDVFKVPVPVGLAGKPLLRFSPQKLHGCSIIGLVDRGSTVVHPVPSTLLEAGSSLILIGTIENEQRFLADYES